MWYKVIDMIEKLEREILALDSEIAHLDSRIDMLECYRRKSSELEELIKESNELETRKLALENQQKAYIQMIIEAPYSLSEIENHINDLTKTKEMLTEEISKTDKKSDNYLEMIAELNCVSRGLRFFENKLEEKTKRSNNR